MLTSYSPYTAYYLSFCSAQTQQGDHAEPPLFPSSSKGFRPMLRIEGPRTNRLAVSGFFCLSSSLPLPPHQQPQHLSHLPVHPSPPTRARGGSSSLIASQNPTRSCAPRELNLPAAAIRRGSMGPSPMAARAAGGCSSAALAFFGSRPLRRAVRRPAAAFAWGQSSPYGGCRSRLAHSLVDSVLDELRSRRRVRVSAK